MKKLTLSILMLALVTSMNGYAQAEATVISNSDQILFQGQWLDELQDRLVVQEYAMKEANQQQQEADSALAMSTHNNNGWLVQLQGETDAQGGQMAHLNIEANKQAGVQQNQAQQLAEQGNQLDEMRVATQAQQQRLNNGEQSAKAQLNQLTSMRAITDEQQQKLSNVEQSAKAQRNQLANMRATTDEQLQKLSNVEQSATVQGDQLKNMQVVSQQQGKQLDQTNMQVVRNTQLSQDNTQRIVSLREELEQMSGALDGSYASAAAFTGLVDPYGVGNLSVSLGLGTHGSAQAVALGVGERFNEHFTLKVGGAYNSSTNSVTAYAGAGFEF